MPANEIEKAYNERRKAMGLPDFREIDEEFELSDLDETNFLFPAIIRRIAEKLDFYSTMIEEVLQPDTSRLYSMHETRFFGEEEKKQMYDLYTRLMNLNRHSLEACLDTNPKMHAYFISGAFNEWLSIKQELAKYIKKMRASWKAQVDVKEDLGYLG